MLEGPSIGDGKICGIRMVVDVRVGLSGREASLVLGLGEKRKSLPIVNQVVLLRRRSWLNENYVEEPDRLQRLSLPSCQLHSNSRDSNSRNNGMVSSDSIPN